MLLFYCVLKNTETIIELTLNLRIVLQHSSSLGSMTVHISCLKWDKGLWIRTQSLPEICYSLSLNYNFRLPQSLQRAMAAEAEAAREARAKVIAAEGEMKASKVNCLFHRYSK